MRTVATVAASCPPLLQQALEPAEADELRPRAQGARRPGPPSPLSLIQAQPEGEACVCHLVEPLGLGAGDGQPPPEGAASAGLVTREQRGSWAYVGVAPDALGSVRALLA